MRRQNIVVKQLLYFDDMWYKGLQIRLACQPGRPSICVVRQILITPDESPKCPRLVYGGQTRRWDRGSMQPGSARTENSAVARVPHFPAVCDGGLGKLSVLCSRQHPQVRSRRCLSAPAFCLAHQHQHTESLTDTSSRVPALRPKHMQRFRPSRQRERRSVGIVLSLPHRSVLRNPGVRPVASSARWLARLTVIGGCLLSSV